MCKLKGKLLGQSWSKEAHNQKATPQTPTQVTVHITKQAYLSEVTSHIVLKICHGDENFRSTSISE